MKTRLKILMMIALFSLSSCQEETYVAKSLPDISIGEPSIAVSNTYSAPANCSTSYVYKNQGTPTVIYESSFYNTKDTVALFIRDFHKLPGNYITKEQNEEGNYDNYTYDIGGNNFTNHQGILPYSSQYIECDIDGTLQPSGRGIKRIVYSKVSWRIFYTQDHYASFQEYLGYNNWGKRFGGSYGNILTPCTVEDGYFF